jgi:predicted benzoate:H+ symporter BenE
MVPLLVAVAILLVLTGVGSLNQATLGVGLVCLAAVAGILARIAQADRHVAERRRLIGRGLNAG